LKNEFPYRRIVVVGTTSSGKSTLAKGLAEKLDVDFIELDALHWEPNWKEAEPEMFRARVEAATRSEVWVVAGNYHVVRDIVWPLPRQYQRVVIKTVIEYCTKHGTNRKSLTIIRADQQNIFLDDKGKPGENR
jgi:adenosyl cobinamide kinase/adenosyl cobinamide phosphate guanylyltransferase